MAESTNESWYVFASNREQGPVTLEVMKRYIGEKKIKATTLVRRNGESGLKPACSYPEFGLAAAPDVPSSHVDVHRQQPTEAPRQTIVGSRAHSAYAVLLVLLLMNYAYACYLMTMDGSPLISIIAAGSPIFIIALVIGRPNSPLMLAISATCAAAATTNSLLMIPSTAALQQVPIALCCGGIAVLLTYRLTRLGKLDWKYYGIPAAIICVAFIGQMVHYLRKDAQTIQLEQALIERLRAESQQYQNFITGYFPTVYKVELQRKGATQWEGRTYWCQSSVLNQDHEPSADSSIEIYPVRATWTGARAGESDFSFSVDTSKNLNR